MRVTLGRMRKKSKPKKKTLIIIILIALLVLILSYIVIDEYRETKEEQQINIFRQGAQYGYEQAIIQIIQQAETCQQVPLRTENKTVNIFDIKCLQQE